MTDLQDGNIFFGDYSPNLCPWIPPKEPQTQIPKSCTGSTPCIRRVFRPLGVIAKLFGLFPCYDLSFVEKLDAKGVRLVHVLDYMYTALVCCVMTAGAIICILLEPGILREMKNGSEMTDYYVITILLYLTLIIGIWSLFVFPKSWSIILHYLNHFVHVDKILQFDGRYALDEKRFARRVCVYLGLVGVGTMIVHFVLFIPGVSAKAEWVDYFLVPIVTMAVMVHTIPTAFFLFFLNSIRVRILQFNDKVRTLLLPITPSRIACRSFQDYGKELDANCKELNQKSMQMAFDLEKLRILHGELSELVHETSSIFGPHLLREFAFSICGIIMYTYFLLFFIGDTDKENDPQKFRYMYIILDIFVLAKVTVICFFSDWIKSEASVLLKLLQKVSVLRVSDECCTQIKMFIKKLDKKTVITASEFFKIDKRLLNSIVGAITMYLVILFQFKMTDNSQEVQKWLATCQNVTGLQDFIYNQ